MQSRYAREMPKNVQIRDLDDATYETLRARAKASGLSLTRYLRGELERLASSPTPAQWLEAVDRNRPAYAGLRREAVEAAFDADHAERR
jgi:hypothetical protein